MSPGPEKSARHKRLPPRTARRSHVARAVTSIRVAHDGRALAYVCERFVCHLPIGQPEELAAELIG